MKTATLVGIIAGVMVIVMSTIVGTHVLVVKPLQAQVQKMTMEVRVAQLEAKVGQLEANMRQVGNILGQAKLDQLPKHLQVQLQALQGLNAGLIELDKRVKVIELPAEPEAELMDEDPEPDAE